ncbi:MAG: sugar-binding protein [Succinivibrio dextrinosolvens]|uniref:substrate-binding domain-containing protein n=1 Tax=Succinivibrio sp. TaxID=2053619 RepID=UPI0025E438A9|nr:sugar-binding protein [Succinivibrio sp.]MBQ9220768.1 sugar-binding protein [Succinivibrio sp.]MDY6419384.1 sugar-binding protein [Succinivibrio dextrinosolvens]MDY6466775.1 sugar-binding protein [Succinivibrio dextrinosolvens]MDY6470849.1 sugar-binding protein [Succinivibrio dextrinosolvens]
MNLVKLLSCSSVAAMMCFAPQVHAYKVGLSMPTQNEDRWYKEGFALQNRLKNAGFEVELFYGGDVDVDLQNRQLIRLANSGANVLVIGPIDGSAMTDALAVAKSKGIAIISYDRLITGTNSVSYYATFDNEMVGHMQGKYLVDKLNLATTSTPKHIELFYGSLNDNNAKFFWKGAMDELRPYIQSGQAVIKSGQTTPEEVNTPDWSGTEANKRMSDLIDKLGYGPGKTRLDGVLCPADCISEGVLFALKRNGYDSSNMPLVTGQDAVPNALKSIADGEQAMTIYKNPNELCNTIVNMVTRLSKGEPVDINDTSTYDNGAKVVDTYLCEPELIDKSNVSKLLN